MRNIIYSLTISFVLLCACKNSNASGTTFQVNTTVAIQDTLQPFQLPKIPVMYTTPEQRADYLVKHYWEHFNFDDTIYIHHSEITEQAWSDYLDILYHVPLETACEAIKETFRKAEKEKKVFEHFTSLADKYLYDPNSPYRNEEFYIPVLESMIESGLLTDTEKIRPVARLELALKNRVETKALDFTYTLESGKQGSLHKIKSDYILLYFNNPGCHSCEEATKNIKNSLRIKYLMSQNKITILSIYPDEELDEWRKHLTDFPEEWINAYDKKQIIRSKNLYDLKAIPTLYLLDKDKKVLLKDATFETIEGYLRENAS